MLPVGPPAGSMERWKRRSQYAPLGSQVYGRAGVICASEVTLRRLGWRIPGLDHVEQLTTRLVQL
ncbi:hypothetical protein GQ600_21982 [Phytophthora cactorum]|nr:hypothetical protein GQ600_21982 [Phytophthora cactorum]